MSGKEAQIYLVVAGGEECVAKVYKDASQRTFKHRVEYTEGRRTRNSRDKRAMNKRTQHGRKQDEAAWRSTEVDMIYRLRDAGVRVPEPINFVDGVLVMELVKDGAGNPAPRLGDLEFAADEAGVVYQKLLGEVVRMLCAGVIHGDLSEFNVLMGVDGPVLIDFPQSVDPAHNQSARKLLLRDVQNLHRFLARFAPEQPIRPYAQEIWSLYQANRLEPGTQLRGDFKGPKGKANTDEVLALIDDATRENQKRLGAPEIEATPEMPRPFRKVVKIAKEPKPPTGAAQRKDEASGGRAKRPRRRAAKGGPASKATLAEGEPARKTRRPRRSKAKARPTAEGSDAGTKRSPKSAPNSRGVKSEGQGTGGTTKRSSRRRRRRPRSAGSSES